MCPRDLHWTVINMKKNKHKLIKHLCHIEYTYGYISYVIHETQHVLPIAESSSGHMYEKIEDNCSHILKRRACIYVVCGMRNACRYIRYQPCMQSAYTYTTMPSWELWLAWFTYLLGIKMLNSLLYRMQIYQQVFHLSVVYAVHIYNVILQHMFTFLAKLTILYIKLNVTIWWSE